MAKKVIFSVAAVLAAIMISVLSVTTMRVKAESDSILVGDVDEDGKLGTNDVYQLLLYVAKSCAGYDVEPVDMNRYDVNSDGKLDTQDAYELLYYIAQIGAGAKDVQWPPKSTVATETTTTESAMTTTTEETTTEIVTTTTEVTTTTPETTTTGVSYEFIDDLLPINVGDKFMYVGPSSYLVYKTPIEQNLTDDVAMTIENGTVFTVDAVWQTGNWLVVTIGEKSDLFIQINRFQYFQKVRESTATTTEAETTKPAVTTTMANAETTNPINTTTTTKATTVTTTTEPVTTTTTNTATGYKFGDIMKFSGISWNIRSACSTSSNSVGAVSGGDTFVILQNMGEKWYQIAYGGVVGYMRFDNSWNFTKTGVVNQEKQISSNDDIYVGEILKFTATSWTLYDTATYSKNIGYVLNGQRLAVLEKNGDNTYKVLLEDATGGYLHCEKMWKYFTEISQ